MKDNKATVKAEIIGKNEYSFTCNNIKKDGKKKCGHTETRKFQIPAYNFRVWCGSCFNEMMIETGEK